MWQIHGANRWATIQTVFGEKSHTMTIRTATKSALREDEVAVRLLMRMMAIPGRSGQERRIIDLLRKELLRAGAKNEWLQHDRAHLKSPIGGEVGNLVLKLPGTVRGQRRLLLAHCDTVPICIGSQPTRDGGRIYSANPATGLGGDDRTGSAVLLLTALKMLKRGLPHRPLTFLWTVQEETGLSGVRNLKASLLGRPALAFNFDGGSADKLTLGATGASRLAITLCGIASHAGMAPEAGVSAIAIASIAIADLQRGGWHGLVQKDGQAGTTNVGVIRGGEATNVVTDLVTIRAEARSHNPGFRRKLVAEIESAFQRATQAVKAVDGRRGSVSIETHDDYESFKLPLNDPSVVAAAAAIRAEGREVEYAIANGGLDANWITAHGYPCVTLGCGQKNIHTVDEEVDVEHFHLARRIAVRLATAEGSRDESRETRAGKAGMSSDESRETRAGKKKPVAAR
jgi:tripeptide aminopeptidase